MGQSPVVAHLDMDAFFARVEKRDRPELEDQPVIVGGLGERGVVSTACYRAREYGVHSAMPTSEARRRCPGATFLSPRGERYREVSGRIRDVLRSYTPHVQPVSLDEAYLDVTGVLHRFESARALGESLRRDVRAETELTGSVGIGPNKMVAKLAAGSCKPDGLRRVPPEEVRSFMRTLDVEDIPGIGPRTVERLHERGLRRVADLQDTDRSVLQDEFGPRAVVLKRRARGEASARVRERDRAKSISHEETYGSDRTDRDGLRDRLYEMVRKVARRLRDKNLEARTVTVKVRRGDFTTLTRQRTGGTSTHNTEDLWSRARRLFEEEVEIDDRGIRLLGAGVSELREAGVQQELFDDHADSRRTELNELVDEVNDEFGRGTLRRARDLPSKEAEDERASFTTTNPGENEKTGEGP